MAMRLQQPAASRSAISFHDNESEYAQLTEENPLDVTSSRRHTPNPSHTGNQLERAAMNQNVEEPPPPYQEMADPLPGATELPATLPMELPVGTSNDDSRFSTIEYSADNSPQLMVHNEEPFPPPPPPRNPARLNSGSWEARSNLSPVPLRLRNEPSHESLKRKPVASSKGSQSQASSFSSSKAREAGFEIEPSPTPTRPGSTSSEPNVTILPSSKSLSHTREPGKATAYLIPFPKPRIKGVKPEDIPERFLIYTPPIPPLSKPAPGEKETLWHKTQRQWQEEVRKATIQRASKSSWQGLKAGTSNLVQKGVSRTKSTSLEFLERASGDMEATEAAEEDHPDGKSTDGRRTGQSRADSVELPAETTTFATAELPADMPSGLRPDSAPIFSNTTNTAADNDPKLKSKVPDKDKDADSSKPKGLSDLTLIYPPSLALTPEQIRTEFSETLLRTATSSRKDALLASTLVPIAAGLDATLIFTLGGFTQMTSTWAYSSTRGALESKKMTKAISRGNLVVRDDGDDASMASTRAAREVEGETDGGSPQASTTTLSNTTSASSAASSAPVRPPLKKDKEKSSSFSLEGSFSKIYPSNRDEKPKPSTSLHLQQSPHILTFQRYLDLACLKASFALFPHVEEVSDDVNESSVLDAIGWKPSPVTRAGVDAGNGGGLTTAEEERYQREEAREDVKRMVRKGAAEWVSWCKAFAKEGAGAGEKKGGK